MINNEYALTSWYSAENFRDTRHWIKITFLGHSFWNFTWTTVSQTWLRNQKEMLKKKIFFFNWLKTIWAFAGIQKKHSRGGILRNRCSENMRPIHKKYLCRSVILTKLLLCSFIDIALRHGCFPVNFLHIFRTLFKKTPMEGSFWAVNNQINLDHDSGQTKMTKLASFNSFLVKNFNANWVVRKIKNGPWNITCESKYKKNELLMNESIKCIIKCSVIYVPLTVQRQQRIISICEQNFILKWSFPKTFLQT